MDWQRKAVVVTWHLDTAKTLVSIDLVKTVSLTTRMFLDRLGNHIEHECKVEV